jgi:hypothetical protein
MSMLSKWVRGPAKKIIRDWYADERQNFTYKLIGKIDLGLGAALAKINERIRARMEAAGFEEPVIATFAFELVEAWKMYAPDANKLSEAIMSGVDEFMQKKVGYIIPNERSKI